jgi:hypothetical protein
VPSGRFTTAAGLLGPAMIRLAAVLVAVAAMSVAPVAAAYPGDPMPGCITQLGSVLCDGPIRPDGTFQRLLEQSRLCYGRLLGDRIGTADDELRNRGH